MYSMLRKLLTLLDIVMWCPAKLFLLREVRLNQQWSNLQDVMSLMSESDWLTFNATLDSRHKFHKHFTDSHLPWYYSWKFHCEIFGECCVFLCLIIIDYETVVHQNVDCKLKLLYLYCMSSHCHCQVWNVSFHFVVYVLSLTATDISIVFLPSFSILFTVLLFKRCVFIW